MRKFALLVACFVVLVAAGGQPAVPTSAFFFVQLTDPQIGMYEKNAGFAQETANMEFAVATVNRLKPAFVVVTGDIVNTAGDPAQIAEYRRIMAKIDPVIGVYHVAGNHDVGNEPTPETVAAYTGVFGPDHYTIALKDFLGIVINSVLMHTPTRVQAQLAEQDVWLESTLAQVRQRKPKHVVLFEHHPVFLKDPGEPDGYENIPASRRTKLLETLKQSGITHVFAGHTHRNVTAKYGDLEIVATAPIGQPLGADDSGLRIVTVGGSGIEHRYFSMGRVPNRIDLTASLFGKK